MVWLGQGSAPGPVSPRSWLEGIYDYAVTVMNPDKIFFGMPAYGWNWQIYDTPENLGKPIGERLIPTMRQNTG